MRYLHIANILMGSMMGRKKQGELAPASNGEPDQLRSAFVGEFSGLDLQGSAKRTVNKHPSGRFVFHPPINPLSIRELSMCTARAAHVEAQPKFDSLRTGLDGASDLANQSGRIK